MIRRAFIVVLTLGAVGLCAAGLATRGDTDPRWSWRIGDTAYFRFGAGVFTAEVDVVIDTQVPAHLPAQIPRWLGAFGYEHLILPNLGEGPGPQHAHIWRVSCPFWALVAFLASYPSVAFIRGPLRRWRRRRRGSCTECAYDLTGNESGVCPECATPVPEPRTRSEAMTIEPHERREGRSR